MIDWLKVMFHCVANLHSMTEYWETCDADILPIRHNYKVWCECGYNKESSNTQKGK